MRIVGIIPARMASSRFPDKPLALINGIPMLAHVYYRSKMCHLMDEVYVATCDQVIVNYIESLGGKAIMTSDTHERASDRCTEAMLKIERDTNQKIDIVVLIQGDEPMLLPQMLEHLVQSLLDDDTLPIANLMTSINSKLEHEDPNEVKVVFDTDYNALYFSREPIPSWKKATSDVPMFKQLGLIVFRRDFLIKYSELYPTPLEIVESVDMLRVLEHGYRIKMIPTKFATVSVDTPEDLSKVESAMQNDELVLKYNSY